MQSHNQPCRGTNPETKIDPDVADLETFDDEKNISPGWLTSKPNRDDFIVFYATVESINNNVLYTIQNIDEIFLETFANRNELRGTWFVQSICCVLDSIDEDLDILMLFTRVQYQVC